MGSQDCINACSFMTAHAVKGRPVSDGTSGVGRRKVSQVLLEKAHGEHSSMLHVARFPISRILSGLTAVYRKTTRQDGSLIRWWKRHGACKGLAARRKCLPFRELLFGGAACISSGGSS